MNVSVLVVDEHAISREGIRSLLASRTQYEVVGEADNGRVAVELARELRPDIVIMDVVLRGLNGVDATRKIVSERPEVRVLALSMCADTDSVSRMIQAGAGGYLLKSCSPEELDVAITSVLEDRFYLSSRLAGATATGTLMRVAGVTVESVVELTPREREVLQLLAEGSNTREIATTLGLSEKTVENHRRQMRERIGLRSMADLVKYAIREGLTQLEA